jgi:hypothetical protein
MKCQSAYRSRREPTATSPIAWIAAIATAGNLPVVATESVIVIIIVPLIILTAGP